MNSLLTGTNVTLLALAAFGVFVWMFWELLSEMRDGESTTYRPARPRRAGEDATRRPFQGWARTSERSEEQRYAGAPPGGRSSLQFSKTLETWIDGDSGDLRGSCRGGPYRGRGLETLSRADCELLDGYCRRNDPEAARLLSAYVARRFGARERTSHRAVENGSMTRAAAYETLGLAIGAGAAEIVKAHRALIKKFHPDHGGTTAQAARINQAKDVLMEKGG